MSPERSKGLSSYIEGLRAINWTPPTLPKGFAPRKIRHAITENERGLGDITPRKPESYDLRETLNTLRAAWRAGQSFENVERRHLKRAPWVFFYPPENTHSWLGTDTDLTTVYLSWLKESKRARSISSMIHVFLRDYPYSIATFQIWRKGLVDLLNQVESIGLNRWRDRCRRFFLLTSDGCAQFAGAWLRNTKSATELLSDAGLTHELSRSKFLANVHARMLRHTFKQLKNNEMELSELERVFAFATQENGKLRFPEESRVIADSLLLPFTGVSPPSGIQVQIQRLLLTHFGDPRITPTSWQGVNESAREVMLHWLVGATLEDFFRLLDHTALDRHWRYRKAFWSAYLERGYITDAWVLLGSQARRIAQAFLSDEASRYGQLSRGVQSNHSVLVLKVGGLTVTEWSHSGTCRLWLPDNQNAPKFYQGNYFRSNLVKQADYEQRHHGAYIGRWQNKLARWIEDQTGIHLMMTDYMP